VDGAAGGLVALLGLADGIELRLQLLLALRVRRVLVVGACEVELGFAGVLVMLVSAARGIGACAMQVPVGSVHGP
jgi:hypothetical protein